MKSKSKIISCEDIHKQVKAFVEDLLVEQEYQEFVEHMNYCLRCQRHIRSVGALSNHIWDLAEVKVPQDLVEAILFEVSKSVRVQKNCKKRFRLQSVVGVLMVVACLLTAAIYYYRHKTETPDVVISTYVQVPKAGMDPAELENVTEEQAEVIYNQLQNIATALGVEDKKNNAEKISAPNPNGVTTVKTVQNENPVISQRRYLHWHVSYSEPDFRASLMQILSVGSIPVLYDASDVMVVKLDPKRMTYLREEIVERSHEASPIQTFSTGVITLDTSDIYLALNFSNKNKADHFHHWHLRFKFNNRDLLRQALVDLHAKFSYQSYSLLVVSLKARDIPMLMEKIRSIPEISTDFGTDGSTAEFPGRDETTISIFLF